MIRKVIRKILEESFSDSLLEGIGDFNYNKTFIPPIEVVKTAQKAISSTGSKLEKAVELSEKKPQSFNQMRKLRDFFTKNKDNKNDNSWDLHGGDACERWVSSELGKFHDENLRTRQNLQKAGGAGNKKGMGIFDINPLDTRKGKNNIR